MIITEGELVLSLDINNPVTIVKGSIICVNSVLSILKGNVIEVDGKKIYCPVNVDDILAIDKSGDTIVIFSDNIMQEIWDKYVLAFNSWKRGIKVVVLTTLPAKEYRWLTSNCALLLGGFKDGKAQYFIE